jgi:hypothetical protein
MVTPAVDPHWPEACPCGGWPNDPGVQVPEQPTLYNHKVLTHQIANDHGFWAVVADLPRVETRAERQQAAAVRLEREARRIKAWETWHAAVNNAKSPPLSSLMAMHEPYLMYGEILCSHCINEYDDHAEWPCAHWNLLVQLAP